MTITTRIIPEKPQIFPAHLSGELDFSAAAIFAATGFFLEKDTWYKGQTALQPACNYTIGEEGEICSTASWWKWHYNPREITLKQATEEFAHLLEEIVKEQTYGKKVILPLSGGLDSRTLAAALRGQNDVMAFSYEFPGGIRESDYGRAISKAMGFPFQSFSVPAGYLWPNLERLAQINGCYAEFTHPRQMAFLDAYPGMGDTFLLGHWGDVLFDDMGVPGTLSHEDQVEVVLKKILKKGGLDLANRLWQAWGLEGSFLSYLRNRIDVLLGNIELEDANAKIRAFKSLYWAPRWTSVNLQVFEAARPIAVPYYHDDMCRFICTVPERLLAGRQIQIEYLKWKVPELAKISWQAHRPFNLYQYSWNKSPWNLPYRIASRFERSVKRILQQPLIQRNWELQFLGSVNKAHLQHHLLENPYLDKWVPAELTRYFWNAFWEKDKVQHAHPVSMLLTLSAFSRQQQYPT